MILIFLPPMKPALYILESKDSFYAFKGLRVLLRLIDDYDKRKQSSRDREELKDINGTLLYLGGINRNQDGGM